MDRNKITSLMFSEELPNQERDKELSTLVGEFLKANEQAANQFTNPASPAPNSENLAESLLDPSMISSGLNADLRKQMSRLVSTQYGPGASNPVTAYLPPIMTLVGQIRQEFESNPLKLLELNPSRREAIARHLDRLSGIASGPGTSMGAADAGGGLRRWVTGPRSTAQEAALRAYFEETALFVIAEAMLLKAWSDRNVRKWKEDDLGRLNSVLDLALKPHVPLDREGWQFTQRNLYSWYNPSPSIQRDIWRSFAAWDLRDEGPSLLIEIVRSARQFQPSWPELRAYDQRFFTSLWRYMPIFGMDPHADLGPFRRRRAAFSPTLRDGSILHGSPESVDWISLESYAFQLFMAELVRLWWGPCPPPTWAVGSGLEVHTRDQLALALGSPKPSLLNRIAEMEACDFALLLEERCVRSNGRTNEAARLREQLNALLYFKKLKSASTSQGDLQACVAASKLRPGGVLLWVREEPLGAIDGDDTLRFLLDRCTLVCEWDFSGVEHALPVRDQLFPKHLYLLRREPNVEVRTSHRPRRIVVQGQIRSHVEVPQFFEDVLSAVSGQAQNRGQWQLLVQDSPTPQKEWAERWPDNSGREALIAIEELRATSVLLASLSTIRPAPSNPVFATGLHRCLRLRAEKSAEGRNLAVNRMTPGLDAEKEGTFLVFVPEESWLAPLAEYLASPCVRNWLDHHAERRGEQWILNEQVVKFIPVHKALLEAMGMPGTDQAALPQEWEYVVSRATSEPKRALENLAGLHALEQGDKNRELARRVKSRVYVEAARAIDGLKATHAKLFSLVGADGHVCWKQLFSVLPRTEFTVVPIHPDIRISGNMAPMQPIGRIDRVKAPMPGIAFASESGGLLMIHSDKPLLIDMLWEQLEGVKHPTWNELIQHLRLPRRLDLAETTACDVLQTHGKQTEVLRQLTDLLSACSDF